ncbi:MAG TPA: hypothetical protein VGU61_12935 [Noviherbaspirillum sp.]|jgi:hypothetical protein|uniref:hypothetical protein n=1 Tax=Noviherbaspirillum sp. TaxID=1926288 RepID=UPI002DDCBD08|nr:hypothetical protein [Noviherbaspirillum sp.]HEV2611168.1 hypothetical protein [Noviherbaspirillum sp.]
MHRPFTSTHRILFAILMAAALVFAQWLGLQHRIVHAGLQHSLAATLSDESAPDQSHAPDASHSCAVFDAAAMADTMHVPPYIAPLMTSNEVLARWAAFRCWDAPLALHFSSRAPPSA